MFHNKLVRLSLASFNISWGPSLSNYEFVRLIIRLIWGGLAPSILIENRQGGKANWKDGVRVANHNFTQRYSAILISTAITYMPN